MSGQAYEIELTLDDLESFTCVARAARELYAARFAAIRLKSTQYQVRIVFNSKAATEEFAEAVGGRVDPWIWFKDHADGGHVSCTPLKNLSEYVPY